MTRFDLHLNPFAILCVTSRDDRESILAAYEERVSDFDADENALLKAQQCLMASKPRLDAELSWLPGVPSAKTWDFLSSIMSGNKPSDLELEQISSLAAANVRVAVLSTASQGEIENCVIGIASVYEKIDPTSLGEILNEERRLSGFPELSESIILSGFGGLREKHVQEVVSSLAEFENPGHIMTAVVEKFVSQRGGSFDFVEAVTAAFDRWTEPHLHRIESQIDDVIKELNQSPKTEAPLGRIENLLEEWDDNNQPRQLIFEAKGIDEPKSRKIYNKLRTLAIDLANEHSQHDSALRVSQAVMHTFPELPSVLDQVSEDIKALKELIDESASFEMFAPLIALLAPAIKNLDSFSLSDEFGEFDEHGSGFGKKLWHTFRSAVMDSMESGVADQPWELLRNFAVHLHNECEETKKAISVVSELLDFDPPPPHAVRQRLEADKSHLQNELRAIQFAEATNRGDYEKASTLAGILANQSPSGSDAAQWREFQQMAKRKLAGQKASKIAWGVLGVITLISLIGIYTPSDEARQTPSRPRSTIIEVPVKPEPSRSASTQQLSEVPPPKGQSGLVLTRSQLRYCTFQQERMEAMIAWFEKSNSTTLADAILVDSYIEDWNGRCYGKKYPQSNRDSIQLELILRRSELQEEGRQLLLSKSSTE